MINFIMHRYCRLRIRMTPNLKENELNTCWNDNLTMNIKFQINLNLSPSANPKKLY